MLELKIKKLRDTAILPTKSHKEDACFDIYCEDYMAEIEPYKMMFIHTGIATEIPNGYWAAVFARSGISTKKGLRPANCVPVIDENYRGEWLIPLYNDSDHSQYVRRGERIAQFTLLPYYQTDIVEVDELDETDRGGNGFGSTGK